MRSFKKLETEHEDLVHDVSYDHYGKRLATCSADQRIKVWDVQENNEWKLSSDWKVCNQKILRGKICFVFCGWFLFSNE